MRPPFTGPPGLVLVVLDRSFPALSRAVVFDGSCPRPLVALWSSARTARLALSNAPGCTRRRTRHGRRLSRSSSTAEGSTPCPSRTRSWAPAVNHDLCRGGPNNASQLRPRARSLVVDHQVSVRTTGSAPRQASYGRGVSLTAPDGEGAATFLVRCESLSRSRRISTTDPLSSSSSAHTHTGSELARWTLRSHWSYSFFAPPNSSRRLVSPVSRNSRASASSSCPGCWQHELRSGHPVSRCGARSTQTNESRAAQTQPI